MGEDLSVGILDALDMDSYRVEKKALLCTQSRAGSLPVTVGFAAAPRHNPVEPRGRGQHLGLGFEAPLDG